MFAQNTRSAKPAKAGLDCDVLVVGSGPAGGAAALLLASYGVSVFCVTKYSALADTPRAHITNQRTAEVFRDMRIEDTLMAQAAPWDLMANTSFCTSLVGEELGRVLSWGTDPHRRADYVSASPCQMVDAPQTVVEPILIGEAQKRGARIRFDTEYISHVDNGDKVVTTVKDRLNGHVYEIKSSYLIGADGAKSQVAKDLDLPFEGPGAVAGALAIVVEIDLTQYVDFRPSVLWWMLQPGADKQGVGLGVLRMIKPWTEWMLMWGYNPADGPPKLDDAFTRTLAENLIGRKDFEMKIKSSSPWTVNHHFASKIAKGRVFCAGDAIHRHPPTNGLGSNTSIQDSYNLCWKLAAVIKGQASPALLDSYDAERAPIARQIVERANKSIGDTSLIIKALELSDTSDPAALQTALDARKAPTAKGSAIRSALRKAIAHKSYEFNAHGVEHNQRYASSAVIPDGTEEPAYERDRELYARPTSWPGAKLPHAWVTIKGRSISTLDLGGQGEFSVWTGIGGCGWIEAVKKLEKELGVGLRVVSIGPGEKVEDPFGKWAELREVEDGGVLLVRPDNYVAFRKMAAPASKEEAFEVLGKALKAVLGV